LLLIWAGLLLHTPVGAQNQTPVVDLEPQAFYVSANKVFHFPGSLLRMQVQNEIAGRVVVNIYNTAGELILALMDQAMAEGERRELKWDLKNTAEEKVGAGLYFIHASMPRGVLLRTIIVIR